MRLLSAILLFSSLLSSVASAQDPRAVEIPAMRPIAWIRPLKEALAKARKEHRLVLLKPVLTSTTGAKLNDETDVWDPASEMIRGGVLTDESVRLFIMRRFVPCSYVQNPGGESDEDAIRLLGPLTPAPPVMDGRQMRVPDQIAFLFVTPEGNLLEERVMGLPSPKSLMETFQSLAQKYPQYFEPTDSEREMLLAPEKNPEHSIAQLEAARLSWELGDWSGCLGFVHEGARSEDPLMNAELAYFSARSCLCRGDYAAAVTELDNAWERLEAARQQSEMETGSWLCDDLLAARARALLDLGQPANALKVYERILKKYPDGNRTGEALYYAGLCDFLLGKTLKSEMEECGALKYVDEAHQYWRRHLDKRPGDVYARRSRIALGLPGDVTCRSPELADRTGWW